jgi:ribonuclease HI
MTKTNKAIKEKVALPAEGVILYADAGAWPNPGYAGWGIHGYTYNTAVPKKGSGNPYAIPTAYGYVMKSELGEERPDEITPIRYIDGFSSIKNITNNCGELIAATNALALAQRYDLPHVRLYTDSMYVVENATIDGIARWESSGWRKAGGQPIANLSEWQEMGRTLNSLKEKDIAYEIIHIAAHSGHLGNSTVDEYATMGRLHAVDQEPKTHITSTEANGYWNSRYDKHPLMHHSRSYLTTAMTSEELNEYFLGLHGKDVDVVGKRDADGAFTYLLLNEKQELIEILKRKITSIAERNDRLVMMHLDRLYDRGVSTRIFNFSLDALSRKNSKRLDLFVTKDGAKDGDPVATELYPPRIAIRAIESLNILKGLLLDWKNNENTKLCQTDITDKVYEKNKKGEQELLPVFAVGFESLKIQAAISTTDGVKSHEVSLTLGVDMPDRNSLKKIEKTAVRVIVITWNISAKSFRYATIVCSDEDVGIWAGFYSNVVYLNDKTESSTMLSCYANVS